MYIDVHCHLDGATYGSLDALMERLQAAEVERVIAVGFDLASSTEAAEYAKKYQGVYFAAGFHPTELNKYREGDLIKIQKLCEHEKCVAVGEIGLDYHYPDTDKERQRELFIRQLEMADALNLPVQIHSRDCAEDTLGILTENRALLRCGGLMHCYSHSTELAQKFLELGLYFSFGGASTWKGAKKAARTISFLPMENILTETDSPYMPPASLYGSFPNTPESIPEICRNIARLKGLETGEAARAVMDNARRLFKKLK